MQTLHNTLEYSRTLLSIRSRQRRHHVYTTVPVSHLQAWMFHASDIIVYTLQIVILIWKYCLINKTTIR